MITEHLHLMDGAIGRSYGFGFLGILGMIGMITSLFILWALSCLGGAACDLAIKFL